jgi:hypothetical protein
MAGVANSAKLVVHSVHGTWPYGLWRQMFRKASRATTNKEPPWFENHSAFQAEVAALTGQHLEWVPYTWSGRNSFEARHLAAKGLSKHLTAWFEKEPEAEHVVIAHSHGGSVSVEAAFILDGQGQNRLSKIITLATPFAEIKPSQRDIRELAARYIALRFGWVPLILITCLVFLFKFVDPDVPTPVLTVFIDYAVLMIAIVTPAFFVVWKMGLFKVRSAHVHDGFRSTSQAWSLYAVRGPRDEASLAINSSQFIDLMSDVLFTQAILTPFDWLKARLTPDTWSGRLRLSLGLGLLVFLVYGTTVLTVSLQEVVRRIVADPVGTMVALILGLVQSVMTVPLVTAYLIGVAYAALTLVGPLVLIPANCVLAIALGRDVLRHQGLMHIECEQVPSGITGIVSTVSVSEDERNQLGLVHFIHATHAARLRVAEILREHRLPS